MSKPTLVYFPLRGRGEVARLALSAAHVEWEEQQPNYEDMKKDRDGYPFGQCPRYIDGDVDVVQSNSIVRFIAKKYKLSGADVHEEVAADMIMEGVESLRQKYLTLVYQDRLEDQAKAKFFATHLDHASTDARNGGSHLAYIEHLVKKCGKDGFAVGSHLTVADLCIFDIFDLLLRVFGDQLKAAYPDLLAHHAKISATPGIKEYLASPKRLPKINGNDLG